MAPRNPSNRRDQLSPVNPAAIEWQGFSWGELLDGLKKDLTLDANNLDMSTVVTALPGTTTAARAYRAAAQNGPGGFGKVLLDTVSFDPGNRFDLTNHRYICPTVGFYQVNGNVSLTATTGDTLIASVFKNGTEIARGNRWMANTAINEVIVADIVKCAAGDYLELFIFSNGGDVLEVSGGITTYLSVVQVG